MSEEVGRHCSIQIQIRAPGREGRVVNFELFYLLIMLSRCSCPAWAVQTEAAQGQSGRAWFVEVVTNPSTGRRRRRRRKRHN
jgi:hypothetical protein